MPLLTPALSWTNSSTGQSYEFYTSPKTWADANAYAQSIGGYLVKIDSVTENSDIYARVASYLPNTNEAWNYSYALDGGGAAYFWLGGSDASVEGSWRWTDNTALSYTRWGTGALWAGSGRTSEPDNYNNQDYLAMSVDIWPYGAGFSLGQGLGDPSYWNDIAGTNTLYFVVEKNPSVTVDTTPPAVSTFMPLDGATGVAVDSNITISFNEPIQEAAVQVPFRFAVVHLREQLSKVLTQRVVV